MRVVGKDFYGMTSVSGSLVKDCGMTSVSGRALEARGYSNVESRVAARRFRVCEMTRALEDSHLTHTFCIGFLQKLIPCTNSCIHDVEHLARRARRRPKGALLVHFYSSAVVYYFQVCGRRCSAIAIHPAMCPKTSAVSFCLLSTEGSLSVAPHLLSSR